MRNIKGINNHAYSFATKTTLPKSNKLSVHFHVKNGFYPSKMLVKVVRIFKF